MAKLNSFRVGRVTVYPRGKVWYLRYHENQIRHQVRGSTDKAAARRLASEVNAQLETGAPVATSFRAVTVAELRRLWLEYHEQVLRSEAPKRSRNTATASRFAELAHDLFSTKSLTSHRCLPFFDPKNTDFTVPQIGSV